MQESDETNLDLRVSGLRSIVEKSFERLFDHPSMTVIELKQPLYEFQNELPDFIQTYPQLADSRLISLTIKKKPYANVEWQIYYVFMKRTLSHASLRLISGGSEILVEIERAKGYKASFADKLVSPTAELLRLRLIQESVDYATMCIDTAVSRS